jgi:hypothetical protein
MKGPHSRSFEPLNYRVTADIIKSSNVMNLTFKLVLQGTRDTPRSDGSNESSDVATN